MRTHPENQRAYHAGYESMAETIKGMGWESARDEFNLIYPHTHKHESLAAYFFAEGEIDALLKHK